mgnify:CR=1 FL=1
MTETTKDNAAIQRRDADTASETERAGGKTGDLTYRPLMDLYDLGDRYEARMDLPGSAPELIEVTAHQGVLTVEARVGDRWGQAGLTPVHAEYGIGDFRRRVRLGEDIDPNKLEATYADGVLTLVLPKRAERQPRRIEVSSG